ncbi:MAG: hypothetical protein ACR2HN_09380 [Tepidiformaceae bacterium]
MDFIWDATWRAYPAAALMAAGLLMTARGLRLEVRGWRTPLGRPGKDLTWMRGFRLAILGLAAVTLSAGWLLQWPVLVAAALIIAFEEALETSIAIWALKQELRCEQPTIRAGDPLG